MTHLTRHCPKCGGHQERSPHSIRGASEWICIECGHVERKGHGIRITGPHSDNKPTCVACGGRTFPTGKAGETKCIVCSRRYSSLIKSPIPFHELLSEVSEIIHQSCVVQPLSRPSSSVFEMSYEYKGGKHAKEEKKVKSET